MKHQIKCADPEQHSMFYSDCEPALRNACVGHLRMDFGSGNEFYSTWWGNRDDLKTKLFRTELDNVINELRGGLLKNRSGMQKYCSYHQSLNLNESYRRSVYFIQKYTLKFCMGRVQVHFCVENICGA